MADDAERNMLHLVLDAMGAGVAVFDAERRLLWANTTLRRWFSRGESLKGKHCSEVYRCRHSGRSGCDLDDAIASGEAASYELQTTDESGRWRCLHQRITPFGGVRRQWLLLSLDVSEERRRREHLHIVNNLAGALTRSLDPHRVQHLVLTCVTAGHALGFNRAFLFLLDADHRHLAGSMAVGPTSQSEAEQIWGEMSRQMLRFEDLLDGNSGPGESDRTLTELITGYRVRCDRRDSILASTVREPHAVLIKASEGARMDGTSLVPLLKLREFVVAPLVARGVAMGALLADNVFSGDPIREDQVLLLEDFAAQASLAIGNALAHRQLRDRMHELEQAQERLVEAERFASVGRMAAHLAHEIRNPLTTIGGFARSVERNRHRPDIVQRNAGIIYEEVMRLEGVLNDALDFTRPVTIHKTMVPINDLLRRVAVEYAQALENASVRLTLDLDETLPPLHADELQIKQVLINLMNNAFDALENATRKQIGLASARIEDAMAIFVSDSGHGIEEKLRKEIFAPFFTTRTGGTGLGLSICRKIMSEHGGDIAVDSAPGRGASFRLLFPGEHAKNRGGNSDRDVV